MRTTADEAVFFEGTNYEQAYQKIKNFSLDAEKENLFVEVLKLFKLRDSIDTCLREAEEKNAEAESILNEIPDKIPDDILCFWRGSLADVQSLLKRVQANWQEIASLYTQLEPLTQALAHFRAQYQLLDMIPKACRENMPLPSPPVTLQSLLISGATLLYQYKRYAEDLFVSAHTLRGNSQRYVEHSKIEKRVDASERKEAEERRQYALKRKALRAQYDERDAKEAAAIEQARLREEQAQFINQVCRLATSIWGVIYLWVMHICSLFRPVTAKSSSISSGIFSPVIDPQTEENRSVPLAADNCLTFCI